MKFFIVILIIQQMYLSTPMNWSYPKEVKKVFISAEQVEKYLKEEKINRESSREFIEEIKVFRVDEYTELEFSTEQKPSEYETVYKLINP